MNSDSFVEIAMNAVWCFDNNGTLDTGELNYLMGLAMRDDKIDEDERHVLSQVFKRALALPDLDSRVAHRIEYLKRHHGIE